MVILRSKSENLGRKRFSASSVMDRSNSNSIEVPLALPAIDGNNSSSSEGSFNAKDNSSPNSLRRMTRRRRSPTSGDGSVPLLCNSNHSLYSGSNHSLYGGSNHSLCGGSDHSLEPRSRSPSKGRRISRSFSASSPRSNSLVKAAKSRFRFTQAFDPVEVLQIVMLLVIIVLVVHLQSGADFTAQSLQKLRQQESLRLLQLHKIERTSLSIHDDIRGRLKDAGVLQEHEDDALEPQQRQLQRMTSEIDHQVLSLQKQIQRAAKKSIIETYGEGPVKVVIELDFGEVAGSAAKEASPDLSATQISIALFPETPHSVWTLLDQVGRSLWDAASLEWDTNSNVLHFHPTKADDSRKNGRLEFVEQHPSNHKTNPGMHHGPWTVGLREAVDENGEPTSDNPLELFINLADNAETQKHETCIGKILDGFYALQRLLEATQMKDGQAETQVKVKTVTAQHITNHELNQVF